MCGPVCKYRAKKLLLHGIVHPPKWNTEYLCLLAFSAYQTNKDARLYTSTSAEVNPMVSQQCIGRSPGFGPLWKISVHIYSIQATTMCVECTRVFVVHPSFCTHTSNACRFVPRYKKNTHKLHHPWHNLDRGLVTPAATFDQSGRLSNEGKKQALG